MSRSQAMRSAFGTLFREPAIFLAELVARWVLVLTSFCLLLYGLIAYTHALEVSDTDLLGLSGLIPGTALAALKHIFAGSGPMLIREAIAVALGMALLWWIVTSASRSVTAAALFGLASPRFRVIAQANSLRLLLAVCVVIVDVGIFVFAAQRAQPQAGTPERSHLWLIAIPLWLLTAVAFSAISWYLSLVPYSREGTLASSLSQVAQVSREAGSQFLWVGLALGLLRLLFFVMGLFALLFVFGIILELPPVMAWLLLGFGAFFFALGSSFLQLLRAAAYARIFIWHGEQGHRQALAAMI